MKRMDGYKRVWIVLVSVLFLLGLLAGCGSEDSNNTSSGGDYDSEQIAEQETDGDESEQSFEDDDAVLASFDPYGASIFDFPYPSDHLLGEDGFIDVSGFPNPLPSSLVEKYVNYANTHIKGWGANSAIYFHFSAGLDLDSLPDEWSSTTAESPIQLINIEPNSPEFGTRVPVKVEFFKDATDYYPENTLAFLPFPGFPLRPSERYAAILLKTIKDDTGSPIGASALVKYALTGVHTGDAMEDKIVDMFAPLRDFLNSESAGIAIDQIAAATVFTVQDPIGELRKIREYIRNDLEVPELIDIDRQPNEDRTEYYAFFGHYRAPNFQQGEIPYESEGGGFAFDDDGKPIVAKYEDLRFLLVIPKDMQMPEGGWPIVMYAHGTTGDYLSFTRSSLAPAKELAKKGLAVIGIDQPMHGDRSEGKQFDVGQMSFNYMNPDSGRTAFRQSAIDTFNLTWALKNGVISVPASISPTGEEITLNPNKILFMGHSHGGISGSIVMALETDIIGSVHSGAGGYLSYTVMYRKDYGDILSLLKVLLGIPEEEEVDILHPIVMLVQTIVDVSDPVNYAPYYVRYAPEGSVHNMLYTSGFYDEQTPYQCNETLMVAAGFPIVKPVGWSIEGLELREIEPVDTPVSGNLTMPDGTAVTCGVRQYNRDENDNHFVIFHDNEAAAMYSEFLRSVAYDEVGVIQ